MVAVVAHLDTVFPEGTDVKVKRQGTRLAAPGIGDNTRGLALMLAVVRAMNAAKFQTTSDLLFVGNVGEEGEGDLRGVKFLLRKGKYKDRIKQFIADRRRRRRSNITRGGVGSLRYRVTFKGPGGHSYGAFGLVNPAFAMGNAIAKFATAAGARPSRRRRSTSASCSGGTSVNSIPADGADGRRHAIGVVRRAEEAERGVPRAREAGGGRGERRALDARREDRRRSEADWRSPVRRNAADVADRADRTAAVVKAFGMTPNYSISSTDSNVPMNMGMPADHDRPRRPRRPGHAPDEWTDVERKVSSRGGEGRDDDHPGGRGVP